MLKRNDIYTVYGLKRILETEEKVIIYGAGDHGKRVADYMIAEGKREKIHSFCVTEKKGDTDHKGIPITEYGEGHLSSPDRLIIVAVSEVYLSEIVEVLQRHGERYCCETRYLNDDIMRKMDPNADPKHIGTYDRVDFLVAGFIKCGTSSLHSALMKIKDVYVPEGKASLFFNWCDRVNDPRAQLIRDYFDKIQEGQTVGAFEPSFAKYPGRTYEFLGGDIKVLFLVRNPVNAVFSAFKMAGRKKGISFLRPAYERSGGRYQDGVFAECIAANGSFAELFRYADHIKQYMELYPRERIKIVFFEELVRRPQEVMDDILRYIGSSCRYMEKELPKENEGNFIMADIRGLEIADRTCRLREEYYYLRDVSDRSGDEIADELAEAQLQYDRAEKIYDIKMTADMRKRLEAYYNDSVRELETLLDKDLTQLWF